MSDLSVSNFNVQPTVHLKNNKNVTDVSDKSVEGKSSSRDAYILGTLAALAAVGACVVTKKALNTRMFKKLFEQDKKLIDNLPVRTDSFKGNSIQERIQNILGKDSKISPHNYDLSKEYPAMRVYRDQGGYKDGMVIPKGIVELEKVTSKDVPSYTSSAISNAVDDATNRIYNLKEEKRLVSSFRFNDPRDIDNTGRMVIFNIFSRDGALTPAQRDFERIKANPKLRAEAEKLFDELLKFKKGNDENGKLIFENLGKYEHLDYDVILSVIQSLAKKA